MLPNDPKTRKECPIARGVLDYFPDAIAAVANVSYVGNEQHNPGQPMHWAREKSSDHADCIARHLLERGTADSDGLLHSAKAAWRALAMLQLELEAREHEEEEARLDAEFAVYVPGEENPYPPPFVAKPGKPLHSGMPKVVQPTLRPEDTDNDKDLLSDDTTEEDRIVAALTDLRTFIVGMDPDFAEQFADTNDGDMVMVQDPEGYHYITFGIPDPIRKVYIAGPMRNYPLYNFPAFDEARDLFLGQHWDVVSPADIDRVESGIDPTVDLEAFEEWWEAGGRKRLLEIILRDVRAVLEADAIALLPGWEHSVGAVAEFFVARWAGKCVLDAETGGPYEKTPNLRALMAAVLDYLEEVD